MTDDELDLLVGLTSTFADDRLAGLALPRFDRDLPEAVMSTSRLTADPAGNPPQSPVPGDAADHVIEVAPRASKGVGRRPGRRRVALAAAAAVLVAGGAALVTRRPPADRPVQVGSPTSGPTTSTLPPLTGATPPINQLFASLTADNALHNQAQTILIKACMSAQGFDWPAPSIDGGDNPFVPPAFGEALGGTDAERLTVGPGFDGAVVELPGGCTGNAERQLAGGDDGRTALEQVPLVLVPIQVEALKQVKAGAAYAVLVANWHDCMAAAGFPEVTDPGPLGAPAEAFPESAVPGEPAPDTPATRQSDVCKTQTDFSPQVNDLLTPEELTRLQAYPGLLDRVAAVQQHVHDEATAVVAGQAPSS